MKSTGKDLVSIPNALYVKKYDKSQETDEERVEAAKEMADKVDKKAFWLGFCEKCAALHVQPIRLLKFAKSKSPHGNLEIWQNFNPSSDSYSYTTPMYGALSTPEAFQTLPRQQLLNIMDSQTAANLASQGAAIQSSSLGGKGSFLGALLGAGGGGLLGHTLAKHDTDLATIAGATGGAGLGHLLGGAIGRSFVSDDPKSHIATADENLDEQIPVSEFKMLPLSKISQEKKAFIPSWGGGQYNFGNTEGLGGSVGYSHLLGLVPVPDLLMRYGGKGGGVSIGGPLPTIGIDQGVTPGWQWNSPRSLWGWGYDKLTGNKTPEEELDELNQSHTDGKITSKQYMKGLGEFINKYQPAEAK